MKAVVSAGAIIAISTPAAAQDGVAERTLTIGKADAFTARSEEQLRPIAAFLARQLADMGIEKVLPVIAENPVALADAMKGGSVDVVIDSPFPVMICRKRARASSLLLANLGGTHTHRGLFFVRRDSGIDSLADLNGKTLALENRTSTMEYFFPKLILRARGIHFRELEPEEAGPRHDEVGYVLAGSQLNIAAWVFYGKADGGVLSSAAWTDQARNPEAYRREFKVIHETSEVPHLVVAVSSGMEPAFQNRIAYELVTMHQTPLGEAALKTSGIDYFAETTPSMLSAFEGVFPTQPRVVR